MKYFFSNTPIVNKSIQADISAFSLDGLGTISLQWQSSTDNSNWDNISGATSDQFLTNSYLVNF